MCVWGGLRKAALDLFCTKLPRLKWSAGAEPASEIPSEAKGPGVEVN